MEIRQIGVNYRGHKFTMNMQRRSRSDPDQIKEVFVDDVYGPILDQIESHNAIVVDVGAYIGDTAVLFHLWGAKQVWLFEPHPTLYELAMMNVRQNGVKYHAMCVGWSDKDETLDIPGRPTRSFGHGKAPFLNPDNPRHHQEIRLVPGKRIINRVLRNHGRITILKIDAEGYETKILPNLGIRLQSVDNLVVECHGKKRLELVEHYLNNIGMKIKGRYNAQEAHNMNTLHAVW